MAPRAAAEERLYSARVYPNRIYPDRAVTVSDFRVNETPRDERGVQYLLLYSHDGTFKVPFEAISEIAIDRFVGRSDEVVRYNATVRLKQGEARTGRIDLVSMRGSVDSAPWHMLLTARDDRGANLHRVVFVE